MYRGERFNSISHLVGAVLALAALVLLVVAASRAGDPWRIVSFSVYGATLVSLYLASTLYHSFRGRAKAVFQRLDHVAIYLLIAGTYTPFALVTLRGAWGWTLFGVNWGLAIVGIVAEFVPRNRWRWISSVLYLVMGWLALVAFGPLVRALAPAGLAWLVAGGVVYTLGFVAYAWKSLPRHHEIWHVLVLGGSGCHFVALLLYVR